MHGALTDPSSVLMAVQMNKLEAEVQHKQAVLQQLEKERQILEAKERVLRNLVPSTDAAVNMLQTQVQGIHVSPAPDIDNTDAPVNNQLAMATYINVPAAIPKSATADNDADSGGMPSPSAAYKAVASGLTNDARIQDVLGKEFVTGYEPGMEVAGASPHQAVLEHELQG